MATVTAGTSLGKVASIFNGNVLTWLLLQIYVDNGAKALLLATAMLSTVLGTAVIAALISTAVSASRWSHISDAESTSLAVFHNCNLYTTSFRDNIT